MFTFACLLAHTTEIAAVEVDGVGRWQGAGAGGDFAAPVAAEVLQTALRRVK